MPEVYFRIRWPDASEQRCYSPSSTITQFLSAGTRYPLPEFVARSREALTLASERVRMRYGFACSSASAQLAAIEQAAQRYATTPDAQVLVEGFDAGVSG